VVPAGLSFTRYSLHIDAQTMLSSASVTEAPTVGATGNNSVRTHWAYNPFGKISYTLSVFASDSAGSPVAVAVGEDNWVQKCKDAINQNLKLRLDLKGPDALVLANAFRHAVGQAPLPLPPVPTQNVVVMDDATAVTIIAVCAILAGVSVVALIVVLLICLYAINQKFKVGVQFASKGPLPWDQELIINLDPR
jgi:hypothetical protein